MTVAAVAEQDGRFLMVEERIEGEVVFNQPAGHLEDGESLTAAVVRETLEETGWHFVPSGIVGVYRWRHPEGRTFVRVVFAGQCRERDGQRTLDEEIVAVHWLSDGELHENRARLRSPLVRACIEDYRAGRSYPLDLLVDLDET